MKRTLNRKCYDCGEILPVISAEEFNSRAAYDGRTGDYVRGVMWTEDAFASEIRGDETKHWECNKCYWQGWFEI